MPDGMREEAHTELERFMQVATEAQQQADGGHLVAGYDLLLAELHRARKLRRAGETPAWIEALVTHYAGSIQRYCEHYGVPLGE